ncbi:MAG: ParB/RepB/Spo0J family partition protein [Candidatus Pelagibacterales bacterium]|jgi:ParB family chromosome partitioning protein|tara:strand:- start:171 stop:1055 length:885 start_codon:yes stop_codon:yes gene_type:complete
MSDEKLKKGLGRGLMSLFGDQDEDIPRGTRPESNNSYLLVSISDLSRNKFQPRNYFNTEKLDELAQSIKKNGIIQPIVVRGGQKGEYEIIAGERRWLAAQKAGLHKVPVVVLDLDDKQTLEISIIENIQREDLNSIEEAKGYNRLMEEFKYNHQKLSEYMGKSRSHISNTLRLLTLPVEIIKLVDDGKITAGQARPLIGRYNAIELANSIIKEKLSARSIENLVKRDKEKQNEKLKPKKETDVNMLLAQRKIEESVGLNTKIITKKKGSGKIIIEFSSVDQFEMLSNLLTKKKR